MTECTIESVGGSVEGKVLDVECGSWHASGLSVLGVGGSSRQPSANMDQPQRLRKEEKESSIHHSAHVR
jgi:hypothetical protein